MAFETYPVEAPGLPRFRCVGSRAYIPTPAGSDMKAGKTFRAFCRSCFRAVDAKVTKNGDARIPDHDRLLWATNIL